MTSCLRHAVVCWLALGALSTRAVVAQELGPESFATGFEPAAGYAPDLPLPSQPGEYPEEWFSWYGDVPPIVSTARAHSGTQSARFAENFSDIQHMAMLNNDPDEFGPMVWEESFWVYISCERSHPYYALRSEPWNDWDGYATYSYQLFLWQPFDDNGYASGFEAALPGALPGQFRWYSWYGDEKASVSDATVHTGVYAIAFPAMHTDVQRPVMNGDPSLPPVTWEERFSVYVPSSLADGDEAFRSEPWNNWPDTGWSYQLFLYRVDNGLANGWRPVVGWGVMENDLRDELGLDPLMDAFATDQWWNVTVVADGSVGCVTEVTVADDSGASYEATGLSEPFSTWGNDLTDDPNETWAFRPERVFYQSMAGSVYLDDISLTEQGVPLRYGWWPELGWGMNDLRDEMGLDPDELLACDQWWNVEVVADGENAIVTSVTVRDDSGATYEAAGLTDPFSVWGMPLDPNDLAPRPEFVSYSSEGDGVFIDDVSIGAPGAGCPGDVDGDGDTDLSDLAALLAAYGSAVGDPNYNPGADFDESGIVDLSDLAFLLSDYGCSG